MTGAFKSQTTPRHSSSESATNTNDDDIEGSTFAIIFISLLALLFAVLLIAVSLYALKLRKEKNELNQKLKGELENGHVAQAQCAVEVQNDQCQDQHMDNNGDVPNPTENMYLELEDSDTRPSEGNLYSEVVHRRGPTTATTELPAENGSTENLYTALQGETMITVGEYAKPNHGNSR